MNSKGLRFARLVDLLARLRSPQGCPWDRRQTMQDLKAYLIDEAYEVTEAIDSGNRETLCEELGDLLFQIVFLAHLAQEEGAFDIDAVIHEIERKMIRRHPHVFGKMHGLDVREVRKQWETIKVEEGKAPRSSVLAGVSEALPSLYRAYRLGLRAARVGFDWKSSRDLLAKVDEELSELKEAMDHADPQAAAEELGDLLFVLANLARHLDREPEGLLRSANQKFVKRFEWLEGALRQQGRSPADATLSEMDQLWEEAKGRERPGNRERPCRKDPED